MSSRPSPAKSKDFELRLVVGIIRHYQDSVKRKYQFCVWLVKNVFLFTITYIQTTKKQYLTKINQ
jgi:hypothetical protein